MTENKTDLPLIELEEMIREPEHAYAELLSDEADIHSLNRIHKEIVQLQNELLVRKQKVMRQNSYEA